METIRDDIPGWWRLFVYGAALLSLCPGCDGVRTAGESAARLNQQTIAEVYRPGGERPPLPVLTVNSPFSDFLIFAMLNQPQIEAAYYEWAAAVQRITVVRSRPDPRLTFQADITDVVMSLMPGLMLDFPAPGKLKAGADVVTAESDAKYFLFESKVLQTAFALKKSCLQLHFLASRIDLTREALRLARELEQLALVRNGVGKVALQDVLRVRIEQERLATDIANLEDSRHSLLIQFKAALGLRAKDATPPLPQPEEITPFHLTSEIFLATALTKNPQLQRMEAEIRLAEASRRLAATTSLPDFSAGVEADVKAWPLLVRPSLSMTLPVWRDKIAAQIAAAQFDKQAAMARLSSEQIAIAVEFAEKSFLFREAGRNLELLNHQLLPMAQQTLIAVQSGYGSGKVDLTAVIDAERMLLEFQLSEVETRLQRELAVAELSLLILGVPPADAPLLPPGDTPAAPGKEGAP